MNKLFFDDFIVGLGIHRVNIVGLVAWNIMES